MPENMESPERYSSPSRPSNSGEPEEFLVNPDHHTQARQLQKSAVAITGRYWSQKMGRHVNHDSLNEKGLFKILEEAKSVWRYLEQPFHIPFVGESGNLREYTADALVIFEPPPAQPWRIAPIMLEVKPASKLPQWLGENEDRVLAATCFAKANGMIFRVVTDEEILDNKQGLISWIESQPVLPIDIRLFLPILHVVAKSNGIMFRDLLRQFKTSGFPSLEIADTVGMLLREGYLSTWPRREGVLKAVLKLRVPASYLGQSVLARANR
ncbi:MAG: TnsA endonuclease N-terminal domain-containing protein [Candidatus Gracilibacteria bacterium]|jgi:hypothetical protein